MDKQNMDLLKKKATEAAVISAGVFLGVAFASPTLRPFLVEYGLREDVAAAVLAGVYGVTSQQVANWINNSL